MSYNATVINIMIAAPGDTQEATRVIYTTIHEWNKSNSLKQGVVLLPVELNLGSAMSKKSAAQKKEIDKIMDECDVLAGAFWTRSGRTDDSLSIADVVEPHLDSSNSFMLFFSTQPVMESCVDPKEYKKFLGFKEMCNDEGISESYDDTEELKEKISSRIGDILKDENIVLNETIIEEPEEEPELKEKPEPEEEPEPDIVAKAPVAKMPEPEPKNEKKPEKKLPELSENAATLLREAGQDAKSTIIRRRKISDTVIMTNDKNFVKNNDMVDIIRWEAAIRELEYKGLISDRNHGGEYYLLTDEGKRVAKLI